MKWTDKKYARPIKIDPREKIDWIKFFRIKFKELLNEGVLYREYKKRGDEALDNHKEG